jgi:SAM-dependent methyltransferase
MNDKERTVVDVSQPVEAAADAEWSPQSGARVTEWIGRPVSADLVVAQIRTLRLAEGFFSSAVLFALNELDVFALLAGGPRSGQEISDRLDAPLDYAERLLNAGVTIGLLSREDDRFANEPLADLVLVPGRQGYLGNWMRLLRHWMRAWVDLGDGVLGGTPVEDPWLHLGGDPGYTRDFSLAMHDYAQLRGSEIVRVVDFSGLKVLDLGGGPGTYAILFARRWPDVQVTIFDLPDVVKIASENCAAAGVDDRVSVIGGNYYEDDVPGRYDVVFLSDTLHQESPDNALLVLQRAYAALKPGGRIVVQAMFLNDDRVSPRWPVLHSLALLLVYGGGRAYTVGETIDLMDRAGFTEITGERLSVVNVNSLIFARRPGDS